MRLNFTDLTWTVQLYSPGGAQTHRHLIRGPTLGPATRVCPRIGIKDSQGH